MKAGTRWHLKLQNLGNNLLFKVPQYNLVHPEEFLIYAVVGVLVGLVSVALRAFGSV